MEVRTKIERPDGETCRSVDDETLMIPGLLFRHPPLGRPVATIVTASVCCALAISLTSPVESWKDESSIASRLGLISRANGKPAIFQNWTIG
jgi:hypothetical protein